MSDKHSPNCLIRLFAVYEHNQDSLSIPEIRVQKDTAESTLPFIVETAPEKGFDASLAVLHPQARKLLASSDPNSVRHLGIAQPIRDELKRARWGFEVPKWARSKVAAIAGLGEEPFTLTFIISHIRVMLFPTEILVLRLEVEPAFVCSDEMVPVIGKLLRSILSRSGNILKGHGRKSVPIRRLFGDQRQQDSVVRRLGADPSRGLIAGLCGKEISIGDIFDGLVTSDSVTPLSGDIYSAGVFLKTNWDGTSDPFGESEQCDAMRLSRAESDHYIPYLTSDRFNGTRVVTTFRNVRFVLSAEGFVCWIRPTADQSFLQNDFSSRFDTVYLGLYLLSLHQRYALVSLAKKLDEAAPSNAVLHHLSKGSLDEIERRAEQLHGIRARVACFYLRTFFRQPTSLTNHQEFYAALQEVHGVSDLLEEVQTSTTELEYMIGSLHEKHTEHLERKKADQLSQQHTSLLQEIKNLFREQERATRNELVLTLVVEGAALPYYTFSLLNKAFEVDKLDAVAIGLTLTVMAMGYTLFRFHHDKAKD